MTTNTFRRFRRAGLCLLFLLIANAALQARDWHISEFRETIVVAPDGSMEVNEHISVRFAGSFNGIYRFIPTEYKGDYGSNYTLFIEVTSITDEAGNALRYKTSHKDGQRRLKIFIPGAEDTSKTVVIRYRVRNGIRYFDDHDELYWNVTGTEWPVPIDAASATVMLPGAATGVRARGFTGGYGSRSEDLSLAINGNALRADTNNPLSIREGMTLVVILNKGAIAQPGWFTKAGWFLRSNEILLLPIVTFLVMGGLWYFKGRDPDPGRSVAPMYEPPPHITPAEAGTLIDDRIDARDITSTLVDLAVRGFLRIEETNNKILFFDNRDYIFHLLKEKQDWTGLADHERTLLSHVFVGADRSVSLSSLKNKFYTAIPTLKSQIMSKLKAQHLYSVDPDTGMVLALVGVIATAALFIVPQALGWANFFLAPGVAAVAIAVSLVIALVFAYFMPAKTVKGAQTRVAVLGFQEFMNRVDRDRLRTMPPDTFEKYLPFAMALGVEERWGEAFEGLIQEPPRWYYGPQTGLFRAALFTNTMSSFTSSAHRTFVSAPRTSSSSSGWGGGRGGGGFSGGGFGGGGGGAF